MLGIWHDVLVARYVDLDVELPRPREFHDLPLIIDDTDEERIYISGVYLGHHACEVAPMENVVVRTDVDRDASQNDARDM